MEIPRAQPRRVEVVARRAPVRADLSAAVLVDHRRLKRREKRPQHHEEGGHARERQRRARHRGNGEPGERGAAAGVDEVAPGLHEGEEKPVADAESRENRGAIGTAWPTSRASGSRRRCRRRRTSRRATARAPGARCGAAGSARRARRRR